MDANQIDALQKPILKAIQKLQTPLSAIAVLRMVDEFYTKEERMQLLAEHRALRDAYTAAVGKMEADDALDLLSPDNEPIEKFGNAAADGPVAPAMTAMTQRKLAHDRLSKFQLQHPLILRLEEVKQSLFAYTFD